MKNSLFLKSLFLTIASTLLLLFSLILYFQSIEVSSGKIKSNEDYMIYVICSICFVVYSIYSLVCYLKKREENSSVLYASLGAGSLILSFYSLGAFFKNWFEALYWKYDFVYKDNQEYLYVGLVCLVLTGYILFSYISSKKNK